MKEGPIAKKDAIKPPIKADDGPGPPPKIDDRKPMDGKPRDGDNPKDAMDALRQGKFTQPAIAAAPTSYLRAVSTAGDFIGQGQMYSYRGDEMKLRTQFGGCVQTNVGGWTIEFAPGKGKNLQPGEYLGARRFPFNDESPGINFSGNGRGCNTIAGLFRVWEIEVQGDQVIRLAVDFVQYCEEKGPPLYGMLRFNSKYQ